MNLENNWKKVVAFLLAFALGCFIFVFLKMEVINFTNVLKANNQFERQKSISIQSVPKINSYDVGRSSRRDKKIVAQTQSTDLNKKNHTEKSAFITSKPRALYTDLARRNYVEGNVTLRVTFLANGTVGDILPVSKLPDGLTEQAIEAAKKIKFEPMKVNGQAKTMTKNIQYSFTIY